ncbi:MAG TPA: nucleoside hydrolase [Actinomycetes bacterium]|nr:nucleoside hydrolase [Actinomycetes bacterium]
MHRLHVDTDIGGDPDDVAALAMLAGRTDVDLVAVTTVLDADGTRAAMARHCLRLVGRPDVPVVAGAPATSGGRRLDPMSELWTGADLRPEPASDDAVARLADSIRSGATVLAIGPLTNLALLERAEPGLLGRARIVAMGGWVHDLEDDLPAWGPGRDWNVAADLDAARTVLPRTGDLTVVTLHETLRTHLRRAHLPRLRAAGAIGALLAHQAEVYAAARDHAGLAAAHEGLPDDLLLFLHDPLAAAVAVGGPGVRVERRAAVVVEDRGALRLTRSPTGRDVGVVTAVDSESITERWLSDTERAGCAGTA